MIRRTISAGLLGLALAFASPLLLPSTMVFAQNVTGSVTGTVTDPSGAVIPGATVTATNVGTGLSTSATSNGDGIFSIRFLPIGQYRVAIMATGFEQQTVAPFQLEINQTVKLDGRLTAGGANTQVEVSAVAPILDTNDASLGITLSTNEIANIPLNGRNFSSVTLFEPGAVNTDPRSLTGQNATERDIGNTGIVSVNGNRNQANNYTLDGADLNEGQNNLIGYNPAPDALAEIRVISANAPAQFGNANGGAIVSVLKSGTSSFHGSVSGYLENDNLDANTFANKFQPAITDPTNPTGLIANPIARNPFTQSIFGGTLGGPILKRKLFFFVDYEGTRRHSGGQSQASVLPAAFRAGDFSSLLTATNGNIQLYNTQNNPQVTGFTPYANNQVPIVNPVARYLFAHPELYPLPNSAPSSGVFGNNFRGAQRTFVQNNQGDLKIEYQHNNNDKYTAFYAQSTAMDSNTALLPVLFPPQNVFPTKLGGGSWIHSFSPAIVNEARFGFTRIRWDQGVPTDPSGQFGLTGNTTVGIPFGAQTYVGFSNQGIGGDASSVGTTANVQVLRDNTFNYYDNLTWQRGRHLISLGFQATRYQQNYINTANFGSLGTFNYSGAFTGQPGGVGYAPADFVLDLVSQTQLGSSVGLVGNRQWRSAYYVQDDWKVTDRLTLNLGLRYEYDQPWYEVNNKTANVLLATGQVIYAGAVPAGAAFGSGLCPTRACYNANYTQILPRFGFAYQAAPRFVLRGGYGATSFFEGDSSNQRLTSSPPFVQSSQLTANTPASATATTPASGGTPFSVESGLNPQFQALNPQYSVWPQNQQPAYIHNFNLTVEYALTNKTSLQATYVGETGHHLADYRNANQLTIGQAQVLAANNFVVTPATTAPYAALVGQGGGLLVTESSAIENYNAGQATVRQRAVRGLEFTFNYTYARAFTTSSGNYGTLENITGSNGAYQDGYNQAADYGPTAQDVRHNFNGVLVYALPVGRGQSFGAHLNPLFDLLVGGWKGSASIIAYTGFPITVNGIGNSSNTNSFGQQRANQYRNLRVRNRSLTHWFGTDPSATPCTGADNGTCAFGPAPANTFGTAAIGSLRTPGYRQVDGSAFKDFHITEAQSVGFRADGFNLFNISSYANPNTNVNDPQFGQIKDVRSPQRQVQFSAHYQF